MKMLIYSHEVPDSVRVVYDYYANDGVYKIHKEKELWVKYIN